MKYMNNETIGIFYIATGVYKEYFENFINTIKYIFPGYNKELIIISDGLKEYDNKFINDAHVHVEDFINYPYPFININKLQIVNYYAEKYNINMIVYFDTFKKLQKKSMQLLIFAYAIFSVLVLNFSVRDGKRCVH